ncbi:MAG TPA: LysR family transcriptional regulator [Candidatus Ventrimonas merdavium]|nr:LysR family transcriptional regulator [Candidatus Ventrimonas merdavium]
MDEKDFEMLHVLNATRNITRAAEQLYMTQSALSKRIKAIEKELDQTIIIRSRQGVRFTPAGELVLESCTAAAEEMERMRQRLDSMQDEVCGTLHAGISMNFAQYRLPDILAEYHRRYPKVHLHITTGQSRHLYRQMADGTLDIAVLRGDYPWDETQFLLSQENICLICREEFRDTPLSDYLYISHRTDSVQTALISRWLHEQDLNPRADGLCVDNITTCMEMVKRGLGWALLPEIALGDFDGIIRPCTFQNGEPFTRRTSIFCQQEAMALPQVHTFMELLKQYRQGGYNGTTDHIARNA